MTTSRHRPRPDPRASVVVVVLMLIASVVPAARGDTRAELERAKARLSELQDSIRSQEAETEQLHVRLGDLVARVDAQRADVDQIRRRLWETEQSLRDTRAELGSLRGRISGRARDVYMRGPVHWIDHLFDSRSLQDLTDRFVLVARLLRQDTDAALGIERIEARLESERRHHEELLRTEGSKLRELSDEQLALEDVFGLQQRKLADLAKARSEALGLIDRLEGELLAAELAAARLTAGKGMPITFGEWAEAFLGRLGAPVSRDNLVVVVTWQNAEYTQATWNPLATTYSMPGATRFNSHGVKNYVSMDQGLQASIATLGRPGHGYEAVVANLRGSADAMTTGRAINASDWCRGCANGNYVIGLIPTVERYYERYASR